MACGLTNTTSKKSQRRYDGCTLRGGKTLGMEKDIKTHILEEAPRAATSFSTFNLTQPLPFPHTQVRITIPVKFYYN